MTTFKPDLTYDAVVAWLQAQPGCPYPAVEFNPGPPSYEGTADTVGPAIVLTVGGGPGLELEDTYDRVFLSVDIAGDQNDPSGSTALGVWLDRCFVAVERPTMIGTSRVLAIRRTGGRPTAVGVDDGDRWHLACSYTARVQYQ